MLVEMVEEVEVPTNSLPAVKSGMYLFWLERIDMSLLENDIYFIELDIVDESTTGLQAKAVPDNGPLTVDQDEKDLNIATGAVDVPPNTQDGAGLPLFQKVKQIRKVITHVGPSCLFIGNDPVKLITLMQITTRKRNVYATLALMHFLPIALAIDRASSS